MPGLPIRQLGALGARIGMSLAGSAPTGAKIPVVLTFRNAAAVYNPATDSMTGGAFNVNVEGMPFNKKETSAPNTEVSDKNLVATTRTILVEAAALRTALTAAAQDPETEIDEGDKAAFEGHNWEVYQVQLDPARALWVVDCRR